MDYQQPQQWVEIDTAAIVQNLREVKTLLKAGVRLIAVVKANAYGHGALGTASILESQGVDFFAVSYLEEALKLRSRGIKSEIMILSPVTEEEQVMQGAQQNITLTLASAYDAQLIDRVSKRYELSLKVHLKIETGLGRFGLEGSEALEICHSLSENPLIKMDGIYTHMVNASSTDSCQQQFSLFQATIEKLQACGYHFTWQHCANSGVLALYPHMQMGAVRIGTLLSGHYPAGVSGGLKLMDPFKFKCRIIAIKKCRKGSTLGYYGTYRLKRDAQIVVIPVGFINGLALEVGNPPSGWLDLAKIILKTILSFLGLNRFTRSVVIQGKNYPIRGKVFMQMALVEIPDDIQLSRQDQVEVPLRKTLVGDGIPRFYRYQEGYISEEDLDPTKAELIVGGRIYA
ncbi:MAG: alanine racemase [Syntrophomonadaceae bacterium]|nr:alanine racemase [Syntrophomonadaceae bacterium]